MKKAILYDNKKNESLSDIMKNIYGYYMSGDWDKSKVLSNTLSKRPSDIINISEDEFIFFNDKLYRIDCTINIFKSHSSSSSLVASSDFYSQYSSIIIVKLHKSGL